MVLDIGVPLRFELERLMECNMAITGSTSDRLLTLGRPIAHENLYMHHIMLLHVQWLVIVRTVEDQVPWPQLLLLQGYR